MFLTLSHICPNKPKHLQAQKWIKMENQRKNLKMENVKKLTDLALEPLER